MEKMEKMNGKYVLEKYENKDAFKQAIGLPEELLSKLLLMPGIVVEFLLNEKTIKVKRSDGFDTSLTIDKDSEIQLGPFTVKLIPKIQDGIYCLTGIREDGMKIVRRYYFDDNGMRMDMTFNNLMMKMFCKRL